MPEILSGMNKLKIINDPVYGFIRVSDPLIYDIIHHSYFQRLRHIKQLGLTYLVYPGAVHSRFQHALGATHLMGLALQVLKEKGTDISPEEILAAKLAILLHDVGHGPFSHTLEGILVENVHHETISQALMEKINLYFGKNLDLAIRIFNGQYEKSFLHQLVSSQLDMDRLDYLRRDSFFTGVSEGIVGFERIIQMLHVHNNTLAIEAKGIYSAEKFLISRRIMYWQVYLHKTVVAAEMMLVMLIKRARLVFSKGENIFLTPALTELFSMTNPESQFDEMLTQFTQIDDSDIDAVIKYWVNHSDRVLSILAKGLVSRNLFRLQIFQEERQMPADFGANILNLLKSKYQFTDDECVYLFAHGVLTNNAYKPETNGIQIYFGNNKLTDIAEASDISNVSALSKTVTKYYLFYPKFLEPIL